MTKISAKAEAATKWAESIAADDTHGYSQANRWGPDYDCSSLVISAFETAGVPVKSAGATYTGNMRATFLKCGFVEVPIIDRQRGDVLLAHNAKTGKGHTAICIDSKNIVHASIDENGKTTGGKKGDQTKKEICTRSYYSYPWDFCLRYKEVETANTKQEDKEVNITMSALEKGDKGEQVKTLQILLNAKFGARLDVDGSFGPKTYNAVCSYQRNHQPPLTPVDGYVGAGTWAALLK